MGRQTGNFEKLYDTFKRKMTLRIFLRLEDKLKLSLQLIKSISSMGNMSILRMAIVKLLSFRTHFGQIQYLLLKDTSLEWLRILLEKLEQT